MSSSLKKHCLPFSIGNNEIIELLKKGAKEMKAPYYTRVSSALRKKIAHYEKELKETGLPKKLALCHISEEVGHGIFLRPDVSAIKKGEFIGIYTGELAVVPVEDQKGNSYSYDLIEELELSKRDLKRFSKHFPILSKKGEYSVKTDALKTGNFTRYINHSSFSPNMEAVIKLMPNGTLEVFLLAKKTIHPGEQLLSPYGGGYWKALDIIPREITPKSYMLQKNGKVIEKEKKKDPYTSEEAKEYFIKFRTGMAEGEEPIVRGLMKAKPSLATKIDLFEDEVNERGITRELALCKLPGTSEWGVFLRPNAPAISKGGFVGVFGGKYSWVKPGANYNNRYAYDLFEKRKGKTKYLVKVDAAKMGNFTREIKHSSEPNVEAVIYELKQGGTQIVFVATKKILPGQQILVDFGKRYLEAYGGDFKLKPTSVILRKKAS